MIIEYKAQKDVTPFIIDDSSQENAERIGLLIKNYDLEISIFKYVWNGSKLLILVSGRIGNKIHNLIEEIGGATNCTDEDAMEFLDNPKKQEYPELDDSLLNIFY